MIFCNYTIMCQDKITPLIYIYIYIDTYVYMRLYVCFLYTNFYCFYDYRINFTWVINLRKKLYQSNISHMSSCIDAIVFRSILILSKVRKNIGLVTSFLIKIHSLRDKLMMILLISHVLLTVFFSN